MNFGTIFHYQILDKLGAAGMGEVWRVRDDRLSRDVAIEVLSIREKGADQCYVS